jgi:hypothetical protein
MGGNSAFFSTTATLLLFLDHDSKRVTGAVTENTIGAPSPIVTTQGIDFPPTRSWVP